MEGALIKTLIILALVPHLARQTACGDHREAQLPFAVYPGKPENAGQNPLLYVSPVYVFMHQTTKLYCLGQIPTN